MSEDLLTKRAIILRDTIVKLEQRLAQKNYSPTFADHYLLQLLDKACKACLALGNQFVSLQTQEETKNHPPYIFEKLVENKIIDQALSKRLLSLIAFRKLILQAALLKGKHVHLKLTPTHLQDFHTFTQKLLLA
ncbi:uncharacterized protein YutE (UPF0331/DUF86 family) [Catalinimonas alkaloidigena]|uniref:hypothetical protein n=1 Tax=Catalinimonas alkaloidigena TaxID=1075417 RepID=UPI002405BACF|nr:hypothetical protein [Catalinimonas alkaloidigena]MDF9795951.1 uncharacterized protein YutE (UPF0331/DUF86 family) [Catalinimonas alkaloidigena]